MIEPVKAVIVGMGARAVIYAREALRHPDRMRIVGVADPDPERVRMARELFAIPPEKCFASAAALSSAPRFADAAINATMDPQHVPTTLPLLRRGYDVLLEKPFAVNAAQADELVACAHAQKRKVMVCHVLRYAPLYRRLKELIASGELGRILNIQMTEQVSYFHESVSYVRGKYASPERCGSGMLLSKCCHDMDLMAWLMADTVPRSVSSVGSLFQYTRDRAPKMAGTHCLADCAIERDCPYSAKRLYIEHPQRWAANIWHEIGRENATEAEKIEYLSRRDTLYSRCVYRCDLSIVDHQSVLVGFQNGATGTFSMNGGAPESSRRILVTGTKGEARGVFEQARLDVARIAADAPLGRLCRSVDLASQADADAHGGGDQALVRDFIALMRGEPTSICRTDLDDSLIGHKLTFLAEESRLQDGERMMYV